MTFTETQGTKDKNKKTNKQKVKVRVGQKLTISNFYQGMTD